MRNGAPGRRSLEERLERKIIRAKASHLVRDECWLWQGARMTSARTGYAIIKIGGGTAVPTIVHRLMYERQHGRVPKGLVLDHVCEVRNCVNPAHLEPVTSGENVRRSYARRRTTSAPHATDLAPASPVRRRNR